MFSALSGSQGFGSAEPSSGPSHKAHTLLLSATPHHSAVEQLLALAPSISSKSVTQGEHPAWQLGCWLWGDN